MRLRTHASLLRDAALAVALAGTLIIDLAGYEEQLDATSVLCALVGTVPLALRRRSPLSVFVVVVAGLQSLAYILPDFEEQSGPYVLSYFVNLYSVGRHASGPRVWLSAVGVLCVVALFVYDDAATFDPAAIAWAAALMGAPWVAGTTLRLKQEREGVMRSAAGLMRREHQENVQRLVASERATIARELHDVVAHAIAVTVLQSRGARRMLSVDEEAVRRALDAIEHTNTQALGDMRRLLAVLRDTETEPSAGPQPSLAHLESLLEHVRQSGLAVDVASTGTPRDVPPGVDLSAYRIIQEALTNVIKHAAATRAEICLAYDEHALGVTISDNGAASTPYGTGHGLIGIRERVAVVGGDVRFGLGATGGFLIEARLPYALEGS